MDAYCLNDGVPNAGTATTCAQCGNGELFVGTNAEFIAALLALRRGERPTMGKISRAQGASVDLGEGETLAPDVPLSERASTDSTITGPDDSADADTEDGDGDLEDDYDELSNDQLRTELGRRALSTTGIKSELIERLRADDRAYNEPLDIGH